jgi:hypothetical protein
MTGFLQSSLIKPVLGVKIRVPRDRSLIDAGWATTHAVIQIG